MVLYKPDGSLYSLRESAEDKKLRVMAPSSEVDEIIREATQQVEDELKLEDQGWINLTQLIGEVLTDQERILNLKLSRLYYTKDPLGAQAVRLWTDYTFGPGMTWKAKDDAAQKVLTVFWNSLANQPVLSVRGQRKSSDKNLVDGEIFFAIFLGAKGQATLRRIDPLEITEIITDPDDVENVLYYKRVWSDRLAVLHTTFYRSTTNIKAEPTKDISGSTVKHTDDALVYHLTFRTITQRGNPLLLPALDWIKQYRRFLASRIAIMLALARFAWKTKVKGGQETVDAIKAQTDDKEINAGSQLLENMGSDTQPIRTNSGARNAYEDGRQIKLQVAAAVGIPEQYFGDISIGNLATAKTVELPMMKMFQSYQAVWADTYRDIFQLVMAHNKIPPDKWYVDIDFPAIAPADVAQAATAILQVLQVMPELAVSDDVMQIALMTLGIDDPAEVLEQLAKEAKAHPEIALTKALKEFREVIKNKNNGHKERVS
ncbi:hypothetical protein LCGC14_0749190 [marine sediment metagenome]|uniref:Portal protein n=1 Tax=marine sediment metagenome TaxID=412755 RepID=A0A0F9Q8R8_9ZZZZ